MMDKKETAYVCTHCLWAGTKPNWTKLAGQLHRTCPRCINYLVSEVKDKPEVE